MFKKGQSGNPRGRPKGAKNIITKKVDALVYARAQEIIDEVLNRHAPYRIYIASFNLSERVRILEETIKELQSNSINIKK